MTNDGWPVAQPKLTNRPYVEQKELRMSVFTKRQRHVMNSDAAYLSEQDDLVTIGKEVGIDLRLDRDLLDARELFERVDLDLVVKVTDVAHDRVVLHLLHVFNANNVLRTHR
jgi:hypothetical protein